MRWEVIDALRNSGKGRLSYNSDWPQSSENAIESCKSPLLLSPHFGCILSRKFSSPISPVYSVDGLSGDPLITELDSSNHLSLFSENETSVLSPPDIGSKETEKSASAMDNELGTGPGLLLLSPRATKVEGCIRVMKEVHRSKGQTRVQKHQELQEKMIQGVSEMASEHLKQRVELMELKQRQDFQNIRDEMEKSGIEVLGRQEKLKEEHRHRTKILNLKLREAELQRQKQEELERQRLAEGRERWYRLNSIQEEVLQVNLQIDPKPRDLPGLDLSGYSVRGNQICSNVSELVRTTRAGEFPSQEVVDAAYHALQEIRALVTSMQQEITMAMEERNQKLKEEKAAQLKQLPQKQTNNTVADNPSMAQKYTQKKTGLQTKSDRSLLQWYQQLQDMCNQCFTSFDVLNSTKDPQEKKTRTELQKVAVMSVNQISGVSGSKLRGVFQKMDDLLSGRKVQCRDKSVSATQHPHGLDFVFYKVAEVFVKQGETEVSAHHETVFPIAVVASGIWELHPKFGDLFLAHLHKLCPYAVPYFPALKAGTSMEEYQRILGYHVHQSGVEQQDSFLKRMSGMMRLYAAIIQLRWPYGNKQGFHPHGLNNGWRWLAQMLNLEPVVDISATLIVDFLEVCGNALIREYQTQFWKMILSIEECYLPRIEAVSSPEHMGSVMRLKHFLQKCLKSKDIPLPKGYLKDSFWQS